jgi:hypothetical protein
MPKHHRHHRPSRTLDPSPSPAVAAIVPPVLVTLMGAFRGYFTAPVWDHVLVLVAGAVLTPGKRTVSAVLHIMGLSQAADFALYHHVLSRARWDSRASARNGLQSRARRSTPSLPMAGLSPTIARSGAIHRPWYDKQRPPLFAEALRAVKKTLDPQSLLNPGVLIDP